MVLSGMRMTIKRRPNFNNSYVYENMLRSQSLGGLNEASYSSKISKTHLNGPCISCCRPVFAVTVIKGFLLASGCGGPPRVLSADVLPSSPWCTKSGYDDCVLFACCCRFGRLRLLGSRAVFCNRRCCSMGILKAVGTASL